jgi:GT2 family glycosyltransferase
VSAPSLTISVLAYRSIDTIEACIRSCLALEHDGAVTLVVREQGGDDAEAALLNRLQQQSDADPGRHMVVTRGENLGFAGGHNLALRERRTDLFLPLNADATLDPAFVQAALAAFDDPAVAAVQGKIVRSDASRTLDTAGLLPLRNRAVVNRGQGQPDVGQFDAPEEIFGPDGAAPLYRRTALDDVAVPFSAFTRGHTPADVVEYFDERFFAYKEDVDLAWRLQWRGWRTMYVPTAVAWHGRGARGSSGMGVRRFVDDRLAQSPTVRRYGFTNHRLMQVKNDDLRVLARDAFPFLSREIAAWSFGLLTDPRLVTAVIALIRRLPETWRKRRWIVQRRRPGADPYAWFVPSAGYARASR